MNDEFDVVYCYPESDVLINNFNIQDNNRLKEIERVLTAARLIELYKKPITGKFNLAHLKKIHYHIFQDIYPWAGQIRTVDIAKGFMFCHTAFIERELEKLFLQLKKDHYLQKYNTTQVINKIAFYFGEVNAIHPFRDGNGRTQREFFRELLLTIGFNIDYTKVEPKAMIDASIASFNGDNSHLIKLFSICINKILNYDNNFKF